MRSLRRAGLALALGGVLAANAAPTLAAETGTVDAQVTVATPCLVVSPPTVDFGTLPFSTQLSQGYSSQAVEIANCGSSAEQVYGRGTDATSAGGTWALTADHDSCYSTVNEFNLKVRSPAGLNEYVGSSDLLLETVGAGGIAAANELMLIMPCVGSDGIGEVMSFQAIFTATF